MALETAYIEWDANTEPDLAYYRVYYGLGPGDYLGFTTTTNTFYLFAGELTQDGTYYFSVTAVDTSNNESDHSAEVSKIIGHPKASRIFPRPKPHRWK
jgi:hypothetical protein